MPLQRDLFLLIVILTYLGVALGEFPRLRMNRATIALVGAVSLMVAGALTFKEAAASLDAYTLVLLFAMMIINVHLRLAGFFASVASLVPLAALVEEFALVRATNLVFLRRLDGDGWARIGALAVGPASVRGLAFMMAGHARHHIRVLDQRYGIRAA